MYNVWFITDSACKGVISALNHPVVFKTQEEAWDFIGKAMSMKQHPRMMWIKEAEYEDVHS